MSGEVLSGYGDPCRECGYSWSIEFEDALELVRAVPARYQSLIGDGDGTALGAGLEWSSGAYVCHVVDNLRIWAERLVGAARGSKKSVALYDSNGLARARNYAAVPIEGAFWSLGLAVEAWESAVSLAVDARVVLVHPERGPQNLSDVVRNNAHDAYHHAWDIQRIVEASR